MVYKQNQKVRVNMRKAYFYKSMMAFTIFVLIVWWFFVVIDVNCACDMDYGYDMVHVMW